MGTGNNALASRYLISVMASPSLLKLCQDKN